MERIIELLERKNQYLEKFYLISEAEFLNFESGDFRNLESFYDCRDKILNIVHHIENELEKLNQQFSDTPKVDSRMTDAAKRALDKKDALVNQILELDLRIISCIENAKSSIIKELRGVRKGRKAMKGYASPTSPTHRFNEEV